MTVTEKKSLVIHNIAFVIVPLAIGAVLYYVFCPDVWFVRLIDSLLGRGERTDALLLSEPVVCFLRNYIFDFIWAFAMTNALFIIFGNNAKAIAVCIAVPVVLGMLLEILQLFGTAQGTADLWDVVAEAVGSVAALIIFKFRRNYT